MTGDVRAPARVRDNRLVVVDGGAQELLARVQEVPRPPIRVEADDVVREQALVDLAPQMLGQHVPVVRLRPRNVDEVRSQRMRHAHPHQTRREIQVVVVEEHGGRRLAFELRDRRVGERLVDGDVAVVPGCGEGGVEVGRARQPPHVVLQEPQRRIRDDVVIAVVCSGIVRDQMQPVRRCFQMRQHDPRRSSQMRSTSRRDERRGCAARSRGRLHRGARRACRSRARM